ncbi:DUF4998 domain-containing protein [Flavobacterium acetivorans]|uniref:DUF4998 domain-containing protein n=1 Tax=Flavobacterium acetivorans TaxID=2893883 RepID=UPI001E3774EB|nr:DUF4998 domain-containing protein [Flavobacterium sp. F-29]UFH34322.1 discoidin domain-containing protein [Flavobacterium sp. F-29]
MKIYKYYALALSIAFFSILISCTDTYSVHEDYLKGGEIAYTNKVDSLSTVSGKNRVKIVGYISNAFNVDEIVVYWNKGKNSQRFPYVKSVSKVDKLELIVDNLEEKSYQFEVYSKNSTNDTSVKMVTYGNVYGDNYRSNLSAREINKTSFGIDNSATINFKPVDEFTRNTEVKYFNMSGVELVKIIESTQSDLVISEIDNSRPIHYRTFFVPSIKDKLGNETSLDLFDSDWKTYTMPQLEPILASTTITPVLGGIQVNWSNPTNKNINVTISYVNGTTKNVVVNSTATAGSTIVSGLLYVSQVVNVAVSDAYANSYGPRSFTTAPLAAVKLVKTSWTIAGFSSEEPAEGAPNGLATATIDGNLATFWHSAWAQSQPVFPHYFIIDMGAVKSISSFEIFRRQGQGGGATVHEFWVSNDNITYTKAATYTGALTTNNAYTVSAAANTKGRYVKYLATAGPNTFTYLGEINVYGAE